MQTGVVDKNENTHTSLRAHLDIKYVLTVESVIVFTKTSEGERIILFFYLPKPFSLPHVCRDQESFTHCN